MSEFLYELFFTPEFENYQIFSDSGYGAIMLILILISLLMIGIYYFIIGNQQWGEPYARLSYWFLFLIINILLVFFSSVYWLAFKVFAITDGWGAIFNDIWLLSAINGVYAIILFFIISLFVKKLTIQTHNIPF